MTNAKTRILLLDTNDAMGGVVRVHLNLLRELDRSRFEVTVACLRRGGNLDAFRALPGVTVLTLETGTKPMNQCSGPLTKMADFFGVFPLLWSVVRLAWYCRRRGIQLIHTSDKKRAVIMTVLLSKLIKIPFVYHIHNNFVDYGFNRRALKLATAIVANSGEMRRDFIQALGEDMERIQVVYNGIDEDEFKPGLPSTLRDELHLTPEKGLIGVVSRLAPDKGQETFLKAAAMVAARNQDAFFVIAGDDSIFSDNEDYIPLLQKMVYELGLSGRVAFLGYRTDIANVYSGLDIVVDAAWREAFGMVVVEPMACGKVVVGTNAGGIPEIIEHGQDGLLFPPRDPDALAEILLGLLQHRDRLSEIGQQARQRVLELFTIEKQTRNIEAVYGQVAHR
jgi:glycosyltransferase involved in cell wall biosynthesis